MHPWEDLAETWTHYLHMVDTLDTAWRSASCGSSVSDDPRSRPRSPSTPTDDFDRLIEAWLPLTIAVNSLNRSMGQPDLYPFVLSPLTMEKLRFIHKLVRGAA